MANEHSLSVSPASPLQPAARPTTAAPAPAAPAQDLQRSWAAYFRNPAVISGMLQFGASLLTPGSGGIGPALSSGAEAATRALQFGQAQQAAQTAAEFKGRELDIKEKGAQATSALAARKQGLAEREAKRKESIDERKLQQAQERLGIWEKSLKTRGVKTGGLSANTVFNGYAKYAQDIASGLSGDEIPEEVRDEIVADPIAWARNRTMEQMAGVGAAGTGAVPPVAPEAPAGGAPPIPAAAGGASPEVIMPLPQAVGETTQQGQAPLPASPQIGESGFPPMEAISDEQWRQIFANPAAEAEAFEIYNPMDVKAKKYLLLQSQSGGVPGLQQSADQFRGGQ